MCKRQDIRKTQIFITTLFPLVLEKAPIAHFSTLQNNVSSSRRCPCSKDGWSHPQLRETIRRHHWRVQPRRQGRRLLQGRRQERRNRARSHHDRGCHGEVLKIGFCMRIIMCLLGNKVCYLICLVFLITFTSDTYSVVCLKTHYFLYIVTQIAIGGRLRVKPSSRL